MGITRFALRNPLVVGVLALALVCFGLYAYFTLGVSEIPNISIPGVQILTNDNGADPGTVETQITKPIEDAVAALPNIDTLTSVSSEGQSRVDVQFTTAANAQLVPVDVERVINAVRSQLPAQASAPSIQSFDSSGFPVIIVGLSGPQPADVLQQVATSRLQRALQSVPGVQSVQVTGGAPREIQVKVDLQKLQAYGLGLNQVQQALQSEQVQAPAGQIASGDKNMTIIFNALVTSPAQLSQIIVASPASGPVFLKDVATVVDGFQSSQSITRVNGIPAVGLIVTKLNSANAIQVSQGVRAALTQLAPVLPAGAHLDVFFDSAIYTQQSFNTVRKTLIEAVFSTGIILLLFLHTWRSTLIVLIAIPTSLLTAVGAMLLLGMNLNLFSMLALTLSVGILVDDSIVVLENIYRHLRLREPPYLAAINGRSEIGFAALTITMVDVVVYLPMALIPGVVGQILAPFALVIAAATLTSLAVSFTLTPLLASRFVRMNHADAQGGSVLTRFGRRWDRGFERLANGYRRLLHAMLTGSVLRVGLRWVVVGVGLLTVVVSGLFVATGLIGFDIFPSGDQSEVDISLTFPPATNLAAMNSIVQPLEAKLKSYPAVTKYYVSFGGGNAGFTVLLVPPNQRTMTSAQLADVLRRDLDPHLPGVRLDTSLPTAFGFGAGGGGSSQPIQVTLRGSDPLVLQQLITRAEDAIKAVPGAVSVNSSNDVVEPQLVFTINRQAAADLGVTAQQAASALQLAVGGSVVGEFQQAGQQNVDIRLMASDTYRLSADQLATLPLVTSSGNVVQLGQLGSVTQGSAPLSIAHYNRARSVTVNASVSGRPAGSVQTDVQAALAKIPLLPGYTIDYGGSGSNNLQGFADIFKALGMGLLLIYLLMVFLFRSLTLPLAVLVSLPLALFGALGAMALTGTPFTVFSMLGFFLLLGLVGKNAILLVDYTDTLRKRGLGRTAALVEAGPTRLRPIIMTTCSVMVALAPVALGLEAGSELLKAAGIVLIGGLLTSTLLTLLFVPAMYTIFDDMQEFVLRVVRRFVQPRQLEPGELALAGKQPVLPVNGTVNPERELTAVGTPARPSRL
jgi:HAE1 family hydrophobic/amphiphilic exporter-1